MTYRRSRKAKPTLYDLTPERPLQEAQRDLAQALRYFYWHSPDSRKEYPGLPDTLMLGPRFASHPTLFILENKVEDAQPTTTQQEVLDLLGRLDGPPITRLVRPSTWSEMMEVITDAARRKSGRSVSDATDR